MNRSQAIAADPGFPWLFADDLPGLQKFLAERGWLAYDEQVVACEHAGAGNMNLTLRVASDRRTIIVKQARPWVEKYDHLAAPWDRAGVEAEFYRLVADLPDVGTRMPKLFAFDAPTRTLCLEDLGRAGDCTDCYHGVALTTEELTVLAQYLRRLHDGTRSGLEAPSVDMTNREMRALNHFHCYVYPVAAENSVDLLAIERELHAAASELRLDQPFLELLHATGQRYLAAGPCLVHGDYFPGSWLRAPAGLRVIDPEFCFFGPPEFDLGVATAHLALAAQPAVSAEHLLKAYEQSDPRRAKIDEPFLARVAAAEVVRRLIGVAQLPLSLPPGGRAALLGRARQAMLAAHWSALW